MKRAFWAVWNRACALWWASERIDRILCAVGLHRKSEWWNGKADAAGKPEVIQYCERVGCKWERWR